MSDKREILKIELEKLKFDPLNPRLPASLQNESNESHIVSWMLENARLIELLESIGSQGFFDGEPLLAYQEHEHFIIVEGNRRLAAVKTLNNPSLAQSRKKKISSIIESAKKPLTSRLPIIVYDKREDILDYLGYRHITGVNSWGSLAKAKYLFQLREALIKRKPDISNDLSQQFEILGNEIGTSANYVAKLLTAINLYFKIESNHFYEIPALSEENISFSLLSTAISYTNIAKFVGLNNTKDIIGESVDDDSLENLTKWLYLQQQDGNTKLGESRNLKTLAKVLASAEAKDKFVKGLSSLHEASLLTDEPEIVVNTAIAEAKEKLRIASDFSAHIDSSNQEQIEELIRIAQIAKSIKTVLESKLNSSNSDEDIFDI